MGPPKLVLSSHPDKSGDQDLLRGLGAIYGGENRPFPSEPLPGTPSHPAPSQERHSQASSSRKASRHALWRVYYVPVHKRVRATPPLTGSIDPCDNGSLAGERPLLRVIGWGVSGFAPLPWGMLVTAPPAQETPCPSGSPPGPQPSQQHFPSVPPTTAPGAQGAGGQEGPILQSQTHLSYGVKLHLLKVWPWPGHQPCGSPLPRLIGGLAAGGVL